MKVLVPVKRVVDHNVRVRVNDEQTGIDLNNVKMAMNPFDEIAVEAAIALKEQGKVTEVTAISIGEKECESELRHAMAMGADNAVLIGCDQSPEPLAVAKLLAAYCEENPCDLVIMGKQAIDDDCNQTGQMLAALMNCPQATFASEIEIEGRDIKVTREVDGGLDTVAFEAPGVITTDLRLNTPRFVSLPNLMKAKRKPVEHKSADGFGVNVSPKLEVLSVVPPEKRSGGEMLESVSALVDKLKSHKAVW
ncbi:Electron transfer flavoprotein subunit beta [Vibrio nigripulchritudo SFn27]|uniref:Electron transfer flavoprotein subunit beta n=1 Tax=Vibrio nigripulchritudo TaxID=28173 RepID=U4KBM3_9VIBR|nr:electron transfer flavoprotein subunit beta/FixA family protein [Vibrio nigripulchritudo]CCN82430.1 Electron transfer flavoprotein subunit beta [Vibrio nigripulchritudo BLFn1]CCN91416.1 Electron transfer flavoprotein subunit beta [Vibrio nigripulchritudo SFn27]CCN97581.1 Electron transfer flavoprotein subunit beta [Vibrio nigripulchritudo ENn2]CCO38723.1 Electron transfer flavoprotein subunit beta [Vibrio nigripulchritudo SFn135]CCO55128.1 Electron transfer flavoprotein subunit beta [Vibrio